MAAQLLHDDGVIKFESEWERCVAFSDPILDDLIDCRQALYTAGLIGEYEDGIAYGNISVRIPGTRQFYISGSQTGGIDQFNKSHIALVVSTDIDRNTLFSRGPVQASSESMSHAVLYEHCDAIQAVVHIHNRAIWSRLKGQVPTTPIHVEYGTPEMANAMIDTIRQGNADCEGVLVMAGHEDGVISYGKTLSEASDYYQPYQTI